MVNFLCQNVLDDVTMNIGQSSLQAIVVIRQPLVIQTHEVEDGGVEVVDGDGVFFGFGAEVV